MTKKEVQKLAALVGVFLFAYFIPLGSEKVTGAILEAFRLLQWYARNHTLACVLPALFIAGAIKSFLSQGAVMKYLGPRSNKLLAYSVASVSGGILAVCSCSVLPIFAGIYQLGAGIGPASAFLYSGPAINVLAIFLTARVLGFQIGLARAVGAILFAFLIGLFMAILFRRREKKKAEGFVLPDEARRARPLWKTALFFLCMVLFLVFSDWYNPGDVVVTMNDGRVLQGNVRYDTRDIIRLQIFEEQQTTDQIVTLDKADVRHIEKVESFAVRVYRVRAYLAGAMFIAVVLMVVSWFSRSEFTQWMAETWDFTKLLVPLLFGGVFAVGFISYLLPEHYIAALVGNNGLFANFFASLTGAGFYFATLTEIPIIQVLMKLGMAQGPALALLLAGPALSIPSILVIQKVIGTKQTLVFVMLTVLMSTTVGMIFGMFTR
jgi:uncharacterized membrane protein YraQ (UPF0718 family)